MEKQPTWVKVAQNGAISEARSRSFLLDRFWILERSIDIHGADFIIQRRLTNKNILDRKAPSLGVVQAKFVSSSDTTQYIHCEYVIDGDLSPRDEFFLLIHTGNEEDPRMFFLTAKEIVENCDKVICDGLSKYRIPGMIINNDKLRVLSRRETLDRIEAQLIKADFSKNREYLSWALSPIDISRDDILPDFNIPVDNYWGNIPEAFYETKVSAAQALREVDMICAILKSIASAIDPSSILEYLEDFRYYCMGGDRKCSISLPDNIYNAEFIDVVERHQKIILELRKHNILRQYLDSQKMLETSFSGFLGGKLPFSDEWTHKSVIEFEKDGILIKNIINELSENSPSSSHIPAADLGRASINGNMLLYNWRPLGVHFGAKTFPELSDRIKNNCRYVSAECMLAIVNRFLGTDY